MFTDKENVGYSVNCLYNDRNSRYNFQGKNNTGGLITIKNPL